MLNTHSLTADSSPILQTCIGTNRTSYHHPSSQLSLVTLLTHHAPLHTPYTLELGADVLADASLLSLATTDNTAVHGARHAVLLLDVQLGEGVLYESAPHCKTDARKRKRRGYLSGKTRPRCFSPGNASRPYPTRSRPFPQPLPCRRNDRSGCSGRGSRDLFPSWNDHGFFKRVNPNAQPGTHHATTNAQNGHLPALERHAC